MIQTFKKMSEDEKYFRSELCAKHLLNAVVFGEHSQFSYEKTKSVLLPAIGFYYSFFHISIAALYLDYSTNTDELKQIKHRKLINAIETKLIKKGVLHPNFRNLFEFLKEIREKSNYNSAIFLYDTYGFFVETELFEEKEMYKMTSEGFTNIFEFIDYVSHHNAKNYNFKQRMQIWIDDSSGDDLIMTYLSNEEQDKVDMFLKNSLLYN